MNQILDWLAMGGYSVYVWPAYGLTVTVLVLNLMFIKKQKKATFQKIQKMFEE